MLKPLRKLIAKTKGYEDLGDALSGLTAAEARAIVVALSERRCLACGQDDGCECSDLVDHAKGLVARRASELG